MNEEEFNKIPNEIITVTLNRNFNGCEKGESVRMIKINGFSQFWVERVDKTIFKVWGKDYQWFDYPKRKLMDLQW
jgi:hypothetical protein